LIRSAIRATLKAEKEEETMKTRAELLEELEEKRIENSKKNDNLNELSILEPETAGGYDPYDNPGLGKEIADGADITNGASSPGRSQEPSRLVVISAVPRDELPAVFLAHQHVGIAAV
jgi:hypothetical protein